MSLSYLQLTQLAQQQVFQARVNFSMNQAAEQIYNESPTAPNHGVRAAYAIKVAAGNFNLAANSLAVMTNPTIVSKALNDGSSTNGILDTDIDTAVASIWNMLAGV